MLLESDKQPENSISNQDFHEPLDNLIRLTKKVGGEGFEDVQDSEILELILQDKEVLTLDGIKEIIDKKETFNDPEEEKHLNEKEKQFYSRNLIKITSSVQNAIEETMSQDPAMTRSLNFKYHCDQALRIYEELYKNYIRQTKQSRISDYFNK